MITLDLVEFIEKEQRNDVSNDVIKSRLLSAGWNNEDIEEGFTKVAPAAYPTVAKTPTVDVSAIRPSTVASNPINPTSEIKQVSSQNNTQPQKTISDPYREPTVDKVILKDNFTTVNKTSDLPKVWSPANTPVKVEETHEPIPTLMPKMTSVQPLVSETPKTLPPKFSPERKMELAKVHASPESVSNTNPANNSFANKAMISSYPKDVKNNFVFEEKRHGVPQFLVWIFVFVVLLCIGAGVAFAYKNGLINIPFLPKVDQNTVTVNYTKSLNTPIQNTVIPADTNAPKDASVDSVVNSNTDINKNVGDSVVDANTETQNSNGALSNGAVEISASKLDELKGKDSMIKSYVSSIELQIYKKYINNKNKYGNVSNPKGDCVAPIKDSLFYTDPVNTGDKNIGHFLNPLLELEDNKGYCFSTTKAWAMSFPLATDTTSYLCVDSNNSELYTKNILSGTVCK